VIGPQPAPSVYSIEEASEAIASALRLGAPGWSVEPIYGTDLEQYYAVRDEDDRHVCTVMVDLKPMTGPTLFATRAADPPPPVGRA
jgi:hypothetical protein